MAVNYLIVHGAHVNVIGCLAAASADSFWELSYVYQSQNSRVLSKDNSLKSEYGATQQEPGQSTEREMKSNKKCTRDSTKDKNAGKNACWRNG